MQNRCSDEKFIYLCVFPFRSASEWVERHRETIKNTLYTYSESLNSDQMLRTLEKEVGPIITKDRVHAIWLLHKTSYFAKYCSNFYQHTEFGKINSHANKTIESWKNGVSIIRTWSWDKGIFDSHCWVLYIVA